MPPQLHIYTNNTDLPAAIRYQVHSFMRMVWFDYDDYNVELSVEEDETQPSHIAVTNGSTLIAFATVVWKTITHADEIYRCGGLANVMTFPHWRKRGYGRQVVDAATRIIRQSSEADIAMLWTAHGNVPFYNRSGWEAMPDMVTLIGAANKPHVYDEEIAMMLFLSDKGKNNRAAFERERVYVGEWTW
jgi:GNAT superfamily N-acetyltransferase